MGLSRCACRTSQGVHPHNTNDSGVTNMSLSGQSQLIITNASLPVSVCPGPLSPEWVRVNSGGATPGQGLPSLQTVHISLVHGHTHAHGTDPRVPLGAYGELPWVTPQPLSSSQALYAQNGAIASCVSHRQMRTLAQTQRSTNMNFRFSFAQLIIDASTPLIVLQAL